MVQSDWSEHMEDWEDEDMNNDLCYCYVGSTRLNTWLNETGHMKNALDISRQPGKRSEDPLAERRNCIPVPIYCFMLCLV